MKKWLFIHLSFLLLLPQLTFAADSGVAKVILVQGEVLASINGKSSQIIKGDWLEEGTQIKTSNRSFAKLLFIDKSTMNIGPKSEIKIDQFPKDKAGIISLEKGQVRSKVTKDYMNMDKGSDKSKLFIKTKTAAMGIRGTEFIAGFDEKSGTSTLDVLEGSVAMAKLSDIEMKDVKQFDQKVLEKAVSSPQAVMVKDGFKADVSKNLTKPSEPQKIPATEMKKLESSDNMMKDKIMSGGSSTLPPGVNSNQFKNTSKEMEKGIMKVVGEAKMEKMKQEAAVMVNRVPASLSQDTKGVGLNTAAGTPNSSANSPLKQPAANAPLPAGSMAPQPAIDTNVMTTMDPTQGVSGATTIAPPPIMAPTSTTTNVTVNVNE